MVILHVKRNDGNQFLYETNCNISIEDLTKELVTANNLRLKVDRAAQAVEELATKGPQKPEALRGLDNLDDYVKHEDLTVINGLKEMPPKTGCREVVDDTHHRTGWLVSEELCKQMLEESMKAKQLVHKTQVDRKVNLTIEDMNNQMDVFKGLIMMAYPAYYGLGAWEPIRVILEDHEQFMENPGQSDWLEVENTTLWIVSKECAPNKIFHELFGKNEKSKFVVKLQKKGSGAPVKEPTIDQETHKQMLSYYHKKQEEQKQLEADNEDAYMNSPWADTRNLKASLHGTGQIKWAGMGGRKM